MTKNPAIFRRSGLAALALLMGGMPAIAPAPAAAQTEYRQITPFMQAIAESASGDREIAAFYRTNGYNGIWTGQTQADIRRREGLLAAIDRAGDHGLPAEALQRELREAGLDRITSQRDLGRAEVALSKLFLRYARDVQTGVLTPKDVDSGIVRTVPLRDRTKLLEDLVASEAAPFLRSLAPTAPEYARLMRAKLQLEAMLVDGGWGPTVPAGSLKPAQSGDAVVALRNRMIRMGYMSRSLSTEYDVDLQQAVQRFQYDNGLEPDGVAGPGTMTEINRQIEDRLPNILVAMERERWMNFERGDRYVWVNLTDFTAAIVDHGRETFKTRSVIGADRADRRSPEFSDVMEHMIINPTWNVPRSIAVKEYLPQLQRNPGAAGHLRLVNSRGQTVSRANIDFTQFNSRNFPFDLKQPPSRRNALGLVKFMFPNSHNIYLHDTPSKSLFEREVRAFSHGCIRLGDPFEFAYTLLAPQTADPKTFFHERLRTGAETQVDLEVQIPVHIVYRTAFTSAKGRLNFRRDVYGRDARIFNALRAAGVEIPAIGS